MNDSPRRHELRDAVRLSLLPLGVALILGLLLVPRRALPEGVPLPVPDPRAMARTDGVDRELAEKARHEPLPGVVRALGSSIRAFHTLEAAQSDSRTIAQARHDVDLALIDALTSIGGSDALLRLRAVQLEDFLNEVGKFEATGEQSAELQAVAGGFVRSIASEGWCNGHTLVPGPAVLRVMFKQMWNAFLGFDLNTGSSAARPTTPPFLVDLALTVDEQRTLYAFYLAHPHPTRTARDTIASARRVANDAKSCRALRVAEQVALESWRLERIGRLAALDPTYPADYARGVARFGCAEYRASAEAFRKWLDEHPDGPFALRAQNYLRAAAAADALE